MIDSKRNFYPLQESTALPFEGKDLCLLARTHMKAEAAQQILRRSTFVSTTSAAPLEDGTNYCLRNAQSNRYLNAHALSEAVTQEDFDGDNSQVWYVKASQTAGYYRLIPRNAPGTCLTVMTTPQLAGAIIGLLPNDDSLASQDWQISQSTSGNWILRSRASGNAMALGFNITTSAPEIGAVTQIAYMDDGILNDEWVLEPFICPVMEYDQGFYMYHNDMATAAIQEELNQVADMAFSAFYREFGLRARSSVSQMIYSLADDCKGMLYGCGHGSTSTCTNTYDGRYDVVHHQNINKAYFWYQQRGAYPNAYHVFWMGHTKCAANPHSFFDLAESYYAGSTPYQPFALLNLPLNVIEEQLAAYVIRSISTSFGALLRSHNGNCILDQSCNTQTIYDQVMGSSPTLSSFWCDTDKATISSNILRFSKSAP